MLSHLSFTPLGPPNILPVPDDERTCPNFCDFVLTHSWRAPKVQSLDSPGFNKIDFNNYSTELKN